MTRSAGDILDQEFLQVRAKILEVAAFFDRLEAAQMAAPSHRDGDQQRLDLLRQGCGILTESQADKAARVQLLFSREYSSDWRQALQI